MDYQPVQHHGYYGAGGASGAAGGLSLPDASSSSEKALMWSHTQYMTESGYSTQAPSISSIDAFLNNEQPQPMDNTMQNLDTMSNSHTAQWNSTNSTSAPQPQPAKTYPMPVQQQPQAPSQPAPQQQQTMNSNEMQGGGAQLDDESDNAVANWINYQDNSEMALKAIPDLLKLLVDEDLVVVQQAAILLNQMSRMEAPRLGLIQTPNAVQCLVDRLNTTADLETARSLVGALYGVSTQKPLGVQAIINSKALQPLVKMLSAPLETIVSYAITTLHNVLLDCGDKVKMQLRKMGAVHQMTPLLNQSQNVKFLSIVLDCLQLLAFGNQETKQIILELGGTQHLVNLLLNNTAYQKMILNATRLLKVLSVCPQNKAALVSLNAIQVLSMHLVTSSSNSQNSANPAQGSAPGNQQQQHSTSNDILQNCLITLRNMSDAATRLNGLEQLVANLLHLLANSSDYAVGTLAAGILANLTCNNENNKKAAVKSNAVHILLKVIQSNMLTPQMKPQLLEPCVCALRHITNRHSEMLLAQEQVRHVNGLSVIAQLMGVAPRHWPVLKAVLGLVRNFCTNQLNAQQLRSNCIIEKLMQILYDAYTEIQLRTNNGAQANLVVKIDDVNLLDIVDLSSASLLALAKEFHNQIIMKDLDCIGFFAQMFFSPVVNIQKAAASLLAELAANKDCAEVIERQSGLHQFVQANFCNQFGALKSIAELSGNSNASTILQHVTTLMNRLQEHKSQGYMRANFHPPGAQFQQQAAPPPEQQFGMHLPPQHQHQLYYNNAPTAYTGNLPPSVQQFPNNGPQFY